MNRGAEKLRKKQIRSQRKSEIKSGKTEENRYSSELHDSWKKPLLSNKKDHILHVHGVLRTDGTFYKRDTTFLFRKYDIHTL